MSLAIMEHPVSTFYDFLVDPAHSGFFCVTTPVNHLIFPLVRRRELNLELVKSCYCSSSHSDQEIHSLHR